LGCASHGSTNSTCSTNITFWVAACTAGRVVSPLLHSQIFNPQRCRSLWRIFSLYHCGVRRLLRQNLYITNKAYREVRDELRSRAPERLCITNQGNTNGLQNLLYLLSRTGRRRRAFCATAKTGNPVFAYKSKPPNTNHSAPYMPQSVFPTSSISQSASSFPLQRRQPLPVFCFLYVNLYIHQ
jgi:hypothetical protein